MTDAQLKKLSYKELVALQNQIAVGIGKRREEERGAVKAKIAQFAASSGFDVNELMSGKAIKRRGGKVAPKFANPKDPTHTWTGRGRKPLWIVAELKKGKKLENFAI